MLGHHRRQLEILRREYCITLFLRNKYTPLVDYFQVRVVLNFYTKMCLLGLLASYGVNSFYTSRPFDV